MRVFKRGEYWWCSYPWQGRTVRRSTRCTTRGAAILVAQRWERERADPDHAAAEAATVGSAVSGYLEQLARSDKPKDTKNFYRQKCGVLIRHLGADSPLNQTVTALRVDQFIADREKEAVAFDEKGAPTRFVTPGTIHKELVALRQVLKRAYRRGEFRKDPRSVLPIGFSTKYVPRKVSLTSEQIEKLFRALGPKRAAYVAFIAATGARRSEARWQRTEDVDVATGTVRLRGTKTVGANRSVAVAPFAMPLLRFAALNGGGRDGLLLERWTNALRDLGKACARAGVPRVTNNDLRRTLSTWLIEAGVSTYAVSKVLGHASTAMLEKVYGAPRVEAVGELVAKDTSDVPLLTMGGAASDGMPSRVRLLYACETDCDRLLPTGTDDACDFTLNSVGPAGLEPATYGLKGRLSSCSYVNGDSSLKEVGAGDVRVSDASDPDAAEEPPSPSPGFPLRRATEALCGLLRDRGMTRYVADDLGDVS